MRILALDIGSSSTRAAVFDERGRRVGRAFARGYALSYGAKGAAELEPRVSRAAVGAALSQFKTRDIVASCAFWHGLLGLDARRRPLTPIFTWADSRSKQCATELRREFSEERILQRTGCMLRFAYWPAKLRWLFRTDRALFRRVKLWVSPSDWLFSEFFGEMATSESMAGGTGLFDQRSRRWDEQLCEALGINAAQLPPVCDAIGNVFSSIGDGAAGNLGCGAITQDIAAINLGTSAAVRVMTNHRSRLPMGLFRYPVGNGDYVFGGAVSNAGNLHDWCRRELRVGRAQRMSRERAATDRAVALPFFATERAPDWPEISATISGLDFSTTGTEFCRVLTTSALYRLTDIFDLLEQTTGQIRRVIVSGGMSRATDVVSVLADVLGRDVEIAEEREASLRGAALHALGVHGDVPVAKPGRVIRRDSTLTRQHQARRRKQHQLLRALTKFL